MEETTKINQLKKLELDENGLIKGISYKFTEEGLVDWRAMIPLKYLYVNPNLKIREKIEKKYGKTYTELDVEKDNIEDSDLVILLVGIKYLLRLRGYNSVEYNIKESNQEFAAVNCLIKFSGNYETFGKEVAFSDNACASIPNTNGFGNNYLLEMATNRALARCARNYLSINIVSREELSSTPEQVVEKQSILSSSIQIKLLQDLLDSRKITWKHLVERMKMDNKYDESYTSIDKLPKDLIFEYITRLKNKAT